MFIFRSTVFVAALVLASLLAACSSDTGIVAATDSSGDEVLTVYKSPTCGCCGAWVDHANSEGLATKVQDTDELSDIKQRFGIKPEFRSCHTAVSSEGYVFEGHVPAKAIQAFLSEKPKDAIGLAVPGMPLGSPGMEQGDSFTPYQVVRIMKDGSSAPYMTINEQQEQYQ